MCVHELNIKYALITLQRHLLQMKRSNLAKLIIGSESQRGTLNERNEIIMDRSPFYEIKLQYEETFKW